MDTEHSRLIHTWGQCQHVAHKQGIIVDGHTWVSQTKHPLILPSIGGKWNSTSWPFETSDMPFYHTVRPRFMKLFLGGKNVSSAGDVHWGEWSRYEGFIGRILLPPFPVSSEMGEEGAGSPWEFTGLVQSWCKFYTKHSSFFLVSPIYQYVLCCLCFFRTCKMIFTILALSVEWRSTTIII